MSDEKTHVLLTGRPFQARVKGVTREITPAIITDRFSFGVGILYKNDYGKTTGLHWGLLTPALPARCFRAMKALEYVTDFDVESGMLCYAWHAASISAIHSSDAAQVQKFESLIGKANLAKARATTMTADEIDTLLVNLNKVRYENDGVASFYDGLDFEFEAKGLYPETPTTILYFKGELPIETEQSEQVAAAKPVPPFSEVMEFNRILWPLFRKKFGNGDFTMEQALQFLGITMEEYRVLESQNV